MYGQTQPCFMSRHSIQPYFFDITWNIEIFLLIVNINLINTENIFCLMCYFVQSILSIFNYQSIDNK
jgi:hypothetical protein